MESKAEDLRRIARDLDFRYLARVVEMRYFGGLTDREVARLLPGTMLKDAG